MDWLIRAVVTGVTSFAATNIDGIFVLMLFFGGREKSVRGRHIVLGQYLGFTALVAISLIGYFARYVAPREWIGLLGFLPMAIGVKKLLEWKKSQDGMSGAKAAGITAASSVSTVAKDRVKLLPPVHHRRVKMGICSKLFNRPISGQASCGFITLALLVTLCVALAAGCSKSTGSAALTVGSIPFGDVRGKDEYNASGIVPLADARFLICDNNTNDALFELDLMPDGQKKGPLIRRPLQGLAPGSVDDLEDMTLVEENGRRYVFVTSSLYVKKAKKDVLDVPPSGVLRVTVNPDDTLSAENMSGLREWLISAYPQLAAAAQIKPDDGGLNIEGFTWDKRRHAFLFGVRTPAPEGKPLVLPIKVKDLAGPWTTANLEAQPPVQLSVEAALGEQGIRGLSNEPDRDAFLVITGKSNGDSNAPFALYEWDGAAGGAVRRFDIAFAKKMKPEGVTRGTIGGRKALVIVDDGGGYQVVWSDQQLPFAGAP